MVGVGHPFLFLIKLRDRGEIQPKVNINHHFLIIYRESFSWGVFIFLSFDFLLDSCLLDPILVIVLSHDWWTSYSCNFHNIHEFNSQTNEFTIVNEVVIFERGCIHHHRMIGASLIGHPYILLIKRSGWNLN